LICHQCNDCYADNAQWDRRRCDDDSSINPPTPPGLPPLPNTYSENNDTIHGIEQIDPVRDSFQCYTATFQGDK
jgi:hypothetical protein